MSLGDLLQYLHACLHSLSPSSFLLLGKKCPFTIKSWPFLLSFKLSFSTDPFSSYHHHFFSLKSFLQRNYEEKQNSFAHTYSTSSHPFHPLRMFQSKFYPYPEIQAVDCSPMEPVSPSFVWALIFKHIEYALFLETCSPPDNVREITRFSLLSSLFTISFGGSYSLPEH